MLVTADGVKVDFSCGVFKNGEQRIKLLGNVNGARCVVVESMAPNPDEKLVRILLTVDALKENGARAVELFMPWMGYSLQNRHFDGEAVSSRVVARAISGSGADSVSVVDVHSDACLSYFTIPVKNISSAPVFSRYMQREQQQYTVVAPDAGSRGRVEDLAKLVNAPAAYLSKMRDEETLDVSGFTLLEGTLGETCVLVDDAVNSGRTVVGVSRWLRSQGVKRVVWCVTHFLGVSESLELILPEVDLLVTTDSVENGLKTEGKIVVLPLELP